MQRFLHATDKHGRIGRACFGSFICFYHQRLHRRKYRKYAHGTFYAHTASSCRSAGLHGHAHIARCGTIDALTRQKYRRRTGRCGRCSGSDRCAHCVCTNRNARRKLGKRTRCSKCCTLTVVYRCIAAGRKRSLKAHFQKYFSASARNMSNMQAKCVLVSIHINALAYKIHRHPTIPSSTDEAARIMKDARLETQNLSYARFLNRDPYR